MAFKILYCILKINRVEMEKIMSKKHVSIEQINRNWVRRKSTYEKAHKYAGSPDLLINRTNPQDRQEKSAKAN